MLCRVTNNIVLPASILVTNLSHIISRKVNVMLVAQCVAELQKLFTIQLNMCSHNFYLPGLCITFINDEGLLVVLNCSCHCFSHVASKLVHFVIN